MEVQVKMKTKQYLIDKEKFLESASEMSGKENKLRVENLEQLLVILLGLLI